MYMYAVCIYYVIDVGVRVDLSSSETFVDLILALGKTLQSVRNHYHFPFSTLTDEVCVSDDIHDVQDPRPSARCPSWSTSEILLSLLLRYPPTL